MRACIQKLLGSWTEGSAGISETPDVVSYNYNGVLLIWQRGQAKVARSGSLAEKANLGWVGARARDGRTPEQVQDTSVLRGWRVIRGAKEGLSLSWPPGRGRWRRVFGCFLTGGLLAWGLAGGVAGAKEPLWWQDPKTEDAEFLYITASAEACPTEQAARDTAILNAQKHLLLSISREVAKLDHILRSVPTSLAGVDEREHVTEQGPQGWVCWVMISYPKAMRENLITNVLTRPPGPPRHKVLVAPIAFDDVAVAEYAEVVAKYRKLGYGLDLWQTVEDELEDSEDFEPDSRPLEVMHQVAAAASSGAEVPGDVPEYLLVPNANFFDYSQEQLIWGKVMETWHHHASIHLRLYQRKLGHWQYVTTSQSDDVDFDELKAANQGARAAVLKLVERWRDKQAVTMAGKP